MTDKLGSGVYVHVLETAGSEDETTGSDVETVGIVVGCINSLIWSGFGCKLHGVVALDSQQ